MDIQTFQSLPTSKVARLVRAAGPQVCGFPINGTRRWFMLEYPEQAETNFAENYLQIAWRRHIELYQLLFDHGIDTLVTPIYGRDILERGEEYRRLLEPGLAWFAHNQDFLDFYKASDVRVHIYGDYRRYFGNSSYAHILGAYAQVTQQTANHKTRRIFFGACADDPLETISQSVISLYQKLGHPPSKQQIIKAYYGEHIEPVNLFIGFERPAVFDIPLILSGFEDLYFMVSPSPYLDSHTLRAILYDHLYARRVQEASYEELTPEDWQTLKEFYTLNRQQVLGLGRMHKTNRFWYPLPHPIELPPQMNEWERL